MCKGVDWMCLAQSGGPVVGLPVTKAKNFRFLLKTGFLYQLKD